ncbi:MAG: hypothetical protein EOR72_00095 [Mesorhizobium sp.]|uniref:phage regulatory CII family protein n=1 Tax=Mesorhizobium sp. TaxID=1871066 RepID=UPI000FE86DC2|nr:phage regulatory CII family protein [Mesorhizobium sp.]RWM19639.1 MAG: hypothetical protein EOR72_00095 [Mesorhizobium sp.]
MVPNANARHFLLKAKQRDLIAAAGGIERAAMVCSYGKSTVGRWANADSTELMPLDAMFALEEETGRFDMSEAIITARGRRLAEVETTAANGNIMTAHAETVVRMGELMTEGALAFADGELTPSESAQIDRSLAKLNNAIGEYRKVLAGAKAAGGLKVVGD